MAATTALMAAALVAGAASTASFAEPPDPGREGRAAEASEGQAASAGGTHWVTLITGDRVGVNTAGRVVAVDRAEGRESVPVRSWAERGHTFDVTLDFVGRDGRPGTEFYT